MESKMSKRLIRIGLYIVFAFVPVWILAWIPTWVGGQHTPLIAQVAWAGCMLFPAVAAFIVPAILKRKDASYKETILSYGLSFKRWWFIILGWLLPVAIGFVSMGVSLALGWGKFDPTASAFLEQYRSMMSPEQYTQMAEQAQGPFFIVLMFIQALTFGALFNSIFTFGEEFGWRGFLQTELGGRGGLGGLGYYGSSLLVGVIWGIWHIPFILQGHNYPGQPLWGSFIMIAWCVLLSLVMGYLRLRSGSVFPAVIFHAVLNPMTGIFSILLGNPDPFLGGMLGVAGFAALIITLGVFIASDFRFFVPSKTARTSASL
jgi:membrane protease YdiL (CAAX protease family)